MTKEQIKQKLELAKIILLLNGNTDKEIVEALEYAIQTMAKEET